MSLCNTNITLGVQFVAQNTVWGMGHWALGIGHPFGFAQGKWGLGTCTERTRVRLVEKSKYWAWAWAWALGMENGGQGG